MKGDAASDTRLDRGTAGTTLLSVTADGFDLTPGLVRFDGRRVEVDVTGLTGPAGLLVQLVSGDSRIGSRAQVGSVSVEATASTDPRVLWSEADRSVTPSEPADVGGWAAEPAGRVTVGNVRLDAATGLWTADLTVTSNARPLGRQVAVAFPNLLNGITVRSPAGITPDGLPYVSVGPAIPNGGLAVGQPSAPVRVTLSNPAQARFVLRPQLLAGSGSRPPALTGPALSSAAIPNRTVLA